MRLAIGSFALLTVLAGCASIPNGPSVAVMPAPGKSFEQFNAEDSVCRQFAQKSIGTSASQAASDSEMKSIAAGTAIGVVAGILGAGNRNGSGVGAAVGMLEGAAIGTGEAQHSQKDFQRRYDIAYEQCMYAKGNQLPDGASYQPQVMYTQPLTEPPPPPSGQ